MEQSLTPGCRYKYILQNHKQCTKTDVQTESLLQILLSIKMYEN